MNDTTVPFFTEVPEATEVKETSLPSLEFVVPNNYSELSLQEKTYIIEDLQDLLNSVWHFLYPGYYRRIAVTFSHGISNLYVVRFVDPAPLLRSSAVFQPEDLEHVLGQW